MPAAWRALFRFGGPVPVVCHSISDAFFLRVILFNPRPMLTTKDYVCRNGRQPSQSTCLSPRAEEHHVESGIRTTIRRSEGGRMSHCAALSTLPDERNI